MRKDQICEISISSIRPTGRTLYLCYFGLREPLVQSQVLPYLRLLRQKGLQIYLLTFEPRFRAQWSLEEITQVRNSLAQQGVHWFARSYHKRPSGLSTFYDILVGAWTAIVLSRRHKLDVFHARSDTPVAMALIAQFATGLRIIFDVRGLMADEYVESGNWRAGSAKYRVTKWLERVALQRADQVVVLTNRMREWVIAHGYTSSERIEVIPCCVDSARFAATGSGRKPSANTFQVIYAGAITGLYLLEEMSRFFLAIRERRPGATFRILTTGPIDFAAKVLRRVGLSGKDFSIAFADPATIPNQLQISDLGLSFRRSGFAQIAASPTKIAEYLAAGLPVVSNAGIGDTEELLVREKVGIVIKSFDATALGLAADQVLALTSDLTLRRRCQAVAHRHFDLATVGGRYATVYKRILGPLENSKISDTPG